MRRAEATATIDAPPDELFAFVSDPANLPNWQSGIVSATVTSPGDIGPGSSARVVRQLMGQHITADMTVASHEPPRRLVLTSTVSGVAAEATLELTPSDGATLIRFSMQIEAQSFFMSTVEGMIASAAQADLTASLQRLRELFMDR